MVLFAAACTSNKNPEPEMRVCTLIGCESGLNVVVNSSLQQDFTVTVSSGGQVLQTFTCTAGQNCAAFVSNQTPTQVKVQVATPMGPVAKDFTPEYKVTRPNGPDCPPDCKQGTVTVTIS